MSGTSYSNNCKYCTYNHSPYYTGDTCLSCNAPFRGERKPKGDMTMLEYGRYERLPSLLLGGFVPPGGFKVPDSVLEGR